MLGDNGVGDRAKCKTETQRKDYKFLSSVVYPLGLIWAANHHRGLNKIMGWFGGELSVLHNQKFGGGKLQG